MNKKTIVPILAVLAICGSLALIYFDRPSRGPKMKLKPYEAVGEVAAQEIAKLLGHKGEVLVIAEDFGKYNMRWADVELASFKKSLKQQGSIHLQGVEKVVDPMISEAAGSRFSAEDFSRMLKSHPKIDGIVLFANFPPTADQELSLLRDSGTKVVAVSTYGPGLKRLLETKVVQVAIVPRTDPLAATSQPRSLREWFDQTYELITPDNVPTLTY